MLIAATLPLLVSQTHSIAEVLPTGFRSATFVTRKLSANQKELGKINKDFGMSYRFDSMSVSLKEPNKLRLEAKVGDTTFLFIVNGSKKLAKAPRAKISVKDDVAGEPGKRQTAFDFGVLTPALMKDYLDAKFVRVDRQNGDYVYDLTYKASTKDETRHRVWIDPKMKVITKREWYSQMGDKRLMATMVYSDFVTASGVYFPGKYSVFNADGKLAGSLSYDNVHINPELDEALFVIK